MNRYHYSAILGILLQLFFLSKQSVAQCNFTITVSTTESRCAATGVINVITTGGSGSFNYTVTGGSINSVTSSGIISGIGPGTYTVTVKDLVSGCIVQENNVIVTGDYQDPRFSITNTEISCLNGSNGTLTVSGLQFGRGPYNYSIAVPSTYGVGTSNTTGVFTNLPAGTYFIRLADSCGGIQTRSAVLYNYNWWISQSIVTKVGCDSADAVITLTDSRGNTNTSGSAFNGFQYGVSRFPGDTSWFSSRSFRFYKGTARSVTLLAKDLCGNIISENWTDPNIPSVNANVTISKITCTGFRATINGQTNLTNPQFCLYNNLNVLVACNTTGVFNNISPFGSYCISIRDNCYDTTIQRCFTVLKPVPSICAAVNINSTSCSIFTASIGCQTNTNILQFCLYTSAGVLVACNTTGIFTNLSPDSYCINAINDPTCYDTTIQRCFTITKPAPAMCSSVNISNQTCTTFTASLGCKNNSNILEYCLYTSGGTLITCNATGVFDNLPYGSYCITAQNDPLCYDTTSQRCFTASKPVPSVSSSVRISNENCSGFDVDLKKQNNLTNPQYCLYTNTNVLIGCNTTGNFSNLAYGSYCMNIINDPACYDTTIQRCFTVAPQVVNLSVSSSADCTPGFADIRLTFSNGIAPLTMNIYNSSNVLVRTITLNNTSSYHIYDLPALSGGLKYKFVVTDACGNKDSVRHSLNALQITKNATANAKCPSGIWPNGFGDISVNCTNNAGSINPKIISKNGASYIQTYNSNSGNNYTFTNLGPATYIIEYSLQSGCSNKVYDTLALDQYVYPSLGQSNAFQCDNNSFNVNASVSGGLLPFTYEIINSLPTIPSIVTPPQASPLFSINNSAAYTLVRLRAIDYCGNGAINDVSILPLANTIVEASSNCYYNNIVLTATAIPNATYSWYKRTQPNDSVLIGNSQTFAIPYLLPTDTGLYICKINLNSNCLTRVANFHVDGSCGGLLLAIPGLNFEGNLIGNNMHLNWTASSTLDATHFSLQRAVGNNAFADISTITASPNNNESSRYYFTDNDIPSGINQYRLKVFKNDGSITYSNIIKATRKNKGELTVMPNPIRSTFSIKFGNDAVGNYNIRILSLEGKVLSNSMHSISPGETKFFDRPRTASSGIYFLEVYNLKTNEKQQIKLLFE